jgi:tetratricopeptide (TPR) repeat protein
MRAPGTAVLALGIGLLSAGAAHAGLYNTAEPLPFPLPQTFNEFQNLYGDLRSVAVQLPGRKNELRDRYLKQAKALEDKERSGRLTSEEAVNLGAYLIRLQRVEDAARVLESAQRQDPDNFMLLSNLATANFLAGRPERAVFYQQRVLHVWPRTSKQFPPAQLAWYRRCERYLLDLLELRQQETRLGRRAEDKLDDLFHVRFTGPDGKYEAGSIPLDQVDRLPLEAGQVVTQLLLWLPFDNRLYWLRAELLNAQGDVRSAYAIVYELVNSRGYTAPELREHRKVLLEAKDALDKQAANDPGFSASAPPPGTAKAASAAPETPKAAATPADRPRDGPGLPDWRTFLVGMASGAAVALLLGQQLRQSRARKATKVG